MPEGHGVPILRRVTARAKTLGDRFRSQGAEDCPKPETHFARTADGWKIALYRYAKADASTRPGHPPILLCHGLGANRYNLDAPGNMSLARWLWRRGFECWLVELRGAGNSSRPRLFNRLRYDWNFDHYVKQDIPAALKLIRSVTRQDHVHWIGHSMGGMVAYAYLMLRAVRGQPPRIRSLVTIASPSMHHTAHPGLDRIVFLRHVLRVLPKIPYGAPTKLLVPFMPIAKHALGFVFGNPKNLRTTDLAKLAWLVPQDLPPTLLAQFLDWYAQRGFADDYQDVEYFRELHRITTPTLVVAGSDDRLSPPKDMEHVYRTLSSDEKKLMVFGKATGCRHEYGHIDLVLGAHAPEEVFPHVLSWIDAH